jgi:hypothetical protein
MSIQIIFIDDETLEDTIYNFEGDDLTSAISQAIIYLQELQQKEMVV